MKNAFLLFLMSFHVKGVLHQETQEQKTADVTLSVMEGETVTLESGVTNIKRNDLTVWTFGDTRIALMNKEPGKFLLFHGDGGMFRDKLHLNKQTGDLTITNITTEHTGFYQLDIFSSGDFFRRFLVTVSAYLPVPIITKVSTQNSSSSSKCALLCSVMNVTHVILSWYKGKSLLSSISVSDLNIRLSLPLEVEYQDTNTYSCVIYNPITNHTQHLNITHVCGIIPPVCNLHPGYIALMCVIVTALAVVGIYCQSKSGKAKHNAQHDGEVQQNHQNGHIQEHTDWLYQADKESPIEIIHVCVSTYLLMKPYEEDVPQRYPRKEDEVDQHNNAQGKISEQENTSTSSSIPWIEYMPNDEGTETCNLETDSQSNRNIEDQQNYAHGETSNLKNSSTCSSIPWKKYMPNDEGTETCNLETDSQSNGIIEDQQNDDVFVEATDAIRNLTVKEGESVTLSIDVTTIKEDDVIMWKFAESTECNQTVEFKTVARRTKANECKYLCGYERFGDRLQLDNQTGSLTVTNIRCVDAGLYKLCMPGKKTWKTFIVAVKPTIQRRNTVE